MGVNVVEREGISFQHPARFILVGTMNPEEGDLRPQLLDRFALSVDVHGLAAPRERMAVVQRHIEFDTDPEAFGSRWQAEEDKLRERIVGAREIVEHVAYSEYDLFKIASLTASLHVDGHRADLVILKAARAQAAFEGRDRVTDADITAAAELALPHRIKRGPFHDEQITSEDLMQRLEQSGSEWSESEAADGASDPQGKKKMIP